MKRLTLITSLLMAALLAFSGCGNKDADQSQNGDTPPASESVDGNNKDDDKASPDDTRLSKSFADVMNSKNYTIEYKSMVDMGDGKEVEMETTMAVKGDQQAFITEIEDQKSQTVIKDKKIYIIDHANKTVVVMNEVSSDTAEMDTLSPADVNLSNLIYTESGREDFFGNMRDYEEYKTGENRIRYYFGDDDDKDDDRDLQGMAFMTSEGTTKWIIDDFSDKVDDKMFEIPADYEKFDMGN